MDDLDQKLNAIMTMIKTGQMTDDDFDQFLELIDENVVKLQVNGLSLFSYYLETTSFLHYDAIRTFANNGAKVNDQDDKGRTPLHWLVGHDFKRSQNTGARNSLLSPSDTDQTTMIKLFLSKGANPSLLDHDGNNVLMLAIISEQSDAVINLLLSCHDESRNLIDQKNILGFTALALYFRSFIARNGSYFSKLIELKPDPTVTDNCGNNYLHNLFLRPVEKYKPAVNYNGCDYRSELSKLIWPGSQPINLLVTISTMGVDITQNNNDGLIPLQVALGFGPFDEDIELRDLACLVPDERVLTELVPKYPTVDPLSLASKVWFVARLTKYGLDFTEDNVLATCLSVKYSNSALIRHLIANGAIPKLSDIMLAMVWKRWPALNAFSEHVSGDDNMNIRDNDRDLLVKTLLSNLLLHGKTMVNLLKKGLRLRFHDFKEVRCPEDLDVLELSIDYFTPALAIEFNSQSSHLLDTLMQMYRIYKDSRIVKLMEKLVKHGLIVSPDCFMLALEHELFDVVICDAVNQENV